MVRCGLSVKVVAASPLWRLIMECRGLVNYWCGRDTRQTDPRSEVVREKDVSALKIHTRMLAVHPAFLIFLLLLLSHVPSPPPSNKSN